MSQRLDALMVREYTGRAGEKKAAFTKVGTAFANQNGGYTLVLDAVPVPSIGQDGSPQIRMLLREPLPPRDGQQLQGGQRAQAPANRGPAPSRGQPYYGLDGPNGDDDIPF